MLKNEVNLNSKRLLLDLFEEQTTLSLKLKYSNKDLKRDTNDSTYIKSELSYQNEDETGNH